MRVREALARAAALRVVIPLLLLLPLLGAAMAWVVGGSLAPLRRIAGRGAAPRRAQPGAH